MAVAPVAYAQSLTTLFASDNGGSNGGAVYFDVVVGPNPLRIVGFDANTSVTGIDFGFFMHFRLGGVGGQETNAAEWSYEGGGVGTGMGEDNPSPVNITDDFTMQANTTYGLALVMGPEAPHEYTNGDGTNEDYSNADLSFSLGSATNVPFTGAVFSPRVWNGTMYYEVVPEPASFAALGLGLIPFLRRRRKVAA